MFYVVALVLLLGHKPLWLDEIWQQLGTRHIDFRGMVAYARDGAGGAFLPFFFQWGILKAFPDSAATSRIPALLFGIGTTVCSWFLARQLRLRRPEIVVVLFMALPILFRYTLEARPYSQAVFFCCWALLLLFRLDERPSVKNALLLMLVAAAGLYTQAFVIFEVVAVAVLLARTGRDQLKGSLYLVLPVVASCVLYLPWYLSASKHWSNGLTQTAAVTVFDSKMPLRVLREYTGGGYVVGFFLLVLMVLGFQATRQRRLAFVLSAGFAAGLILPLVADQKLQYFYAARHLIFALPAGILLAAIAWEAITPKRLCAALAALLAVLIGSVATIAVKEAGPHEDWKSVAGHLASLSAQGNCIEAVKPQGMIYFDFFQPSLKSSGCTPASQKAVLIADPYTPQSLLDAQSRRMKREGYEEARRENVNGFRTAYFLLRGH